MVSNLVKYSVLSVINPSLWRIITQQFNLYKYIYYIYVYKYILSFISFIASQHFTKLASFEASTFGAVAAPQKETADLFEVEASDYPAW